MNVRDAMLTRVRQAVQEGNRAGAIPNLPERGSVGYQGAANPVERFCTELAAAGGKAYLAADDAAALQMVQQILQATSAKKVLLSRGGLVDQMQLSKKLPSDHLQVSSLDDAESDAKETFFAADVGITNVHKLIAETGSIVMTARPNEPRSVSLLPPIHIALADRSQLLPDLFDLFDLFSPLNPLPSNLTLITGPSKTGDIELRLVTGVHGPGEVHVILLDDSANP